LSDGEQASDYDGADENFLELILAESDKRIAAQLQIMLANDSRSNGLLAAAATLAAGAFAVAGSQLGKDGNLELLVGASVFAIVASFAAIAAVWALWPVGVDVQGWSPRLFVPDISKQKSSLDVKKSIASYNQTKIDDNDKRNKNLSVRTRVAMICVVAAPIFSGISLILIACVAALGTGCTQ
jgi:hypothetical protein